MVANTGTLTVARELVRDALRTRRNANLSRVLINVTSRVNYTEAEDIVPDSMSMESIWTYLREHYNSAAK